MADPTLSPEQLRRIDRRLLLSALGIPGFGLLCGALLVLSWGVGCTTSDRRALARDGVRVPGQVIRVFEKEVKSTRKGRTYTSTIEMANVRFTDAEGQLQSKAIQTYGTTFGKHYRGKDALGRELPQEPEDVTIVYFRGEPDSAVLEQDLIPESEAESIETLQAWLLFIGIACAPLSLGAWVWFHRLDRRYGKLIPP